MQLCGGPATWRMAIASAGGMWCCDVFPGASLSCAVHALKISALRLRAGELHGLLPHTSTAKPDLLGLVGENIEHVPSLP